MAATIKLGNKEWAAKKDSLLAYNDENNNFKPLPFDFTRASSATYVGDDGLIKTSTTAQPRIDFTDNTDGHLLLEPASTNLIPYSEDFSQWSRIEVSTDENYTSPNGTLNAVKITDNSVNTTHRVLLLTTTASSGNFTYSVFLKKGTMTDAVLNVYSNGTKAVATIDLENGTITASGGGVNAKIEDYGNDWYRCSIGGTLASTATYVYLYLSDSKNAYVGNGDFLYMYGAQLEELPYATSYIPTSGGTVTRAAETCFGSGNDQVINSTEGVLYAEVEFNQTGITNGLFAISDGTINNFLMLRYAPTNKFQIESTGGVNIIESSVRASGNYKVAVKYDSTGVELWVSGNKVIETSTQSTMSGINQLMVGKSPYGNIVGCKIKQLTVYNTALKDSELKTLTT